MPDPAIRRELEGRGVVEGKGTYVCHESTGEKKIVSSLQIYRLGKTRMLFPCGEPCAQYYDSLRNPGERANFAVSPVIGSLYDESVSYTKGSETRLRTLLFNCDVRRPMYH